MAKRVVSIPINNYSMETITNDIARVSINVYHSGINFNGSYFEEESTENSKDTFALKPIVCAYQYDENEEVEDFGDHSAEETPVGCIAENNNYSVNEIDGEKWVTVEGVIYKEYCPEAYELLLDGKKISMEIEVLEGKKNKEDGLYHISKFNLLAITILGDNIPPAMGDNATITLFSKVDSETFVAKFSEIIKRSKEILENKGGDLVLKRDEIIQKFSAIKDCEGYSAIVENTDLSEEELEKQLFTLSQQQLYRRVDEALACKKVKKKCSSDYGREYEYEVTQYWLEDIISEENLAIIQDKQDYKYYGCKYTVNGDTVTIDFDNKVRYIKDDWRPFQSGDVEPIINILPFSEEEIVKTVETFMQSEMEAKVNEAIEKTKAEFNVKETEEYKALEEEKTALFSEVEELRQFKADKDLEAKEEKYNEVFSKYEVLKDTEGYKALESNKFDFSLEDLEKELKVLAYDNGQTIVKKFSKEPINLPVDGINNNTNAQEDFYTNRYGDVSKFVNR